MTGQADAFGKDAFVRALRVSRETAERFEAWRALLEKWSERINLVAPSTLPAFWRRHALDGAQLFDLDPSASTWADLGSGAGAPGLAIALLARDRDRPVVVHLIESNAKKAAFLREAVRATQAPAIVEARRVEACDHLTGRIDVVTARALASLDRLWTLSEPLLAETGRAIFLKGREASREIGEAKALAASGRAIASRASLSDPEGAIVCISAAPRADRSA